MKAFPYILSCFFLILLPLALSPAHAGLGKAKKLVLEELATQTLEVETDLSLVDLQNSFGVDLGVGVSVRPNRDKKTYSRFESIDLEASLGSEFADLAPVFVKGLRGRNIKVVRQFSNQKDAVDLLKYPTRSWKDLPYNAENAVALPDRTLVSFKSVLSLEFGARAAVNQGLQTVSGGVSYVAYGDFLVEVFKFSGKKVLVRFVSRQDQTKAISGKWKAGPDLQIFPKVIEKEVEKILSVEVGFTASSAKGHLLVFEYIFDLENKDAQVAFNRIVDPSLWTRFRDVYKIANPLRNAGDGDQVALLRFKEAEALSQQSLGKKKPAVVSYVRGESDYRRSQQGIKANILIAKSSRSENLVEMDFDFKDVNGEDQAFRISNLTLSQGRSFLFDRFRRENIQQIDGVLSLVPIPVLEDRKSSVREIKEFQSLVVTSSRDEKTRTALEQHGVSGALRRMVPEKYHAQLNKVAIKADDLLVADARTDVSLVINRQAFLQGARLTQRQIRKVIIEHLNRLSDKVGHFGSGPYGNTYGVENPTDPNGSEYTPRPRYPRGINEGAWARTNLKDIREILDELPKILRQSSDVNKEGLKNSKMDRWNSFIALKDNYLFTIAGPGLLTRIVDRADKLFGPVQPEIDFPTGVSLSIKTVFRKMLGDKSQNDFEIQLGDVENLASYGAIDRIRRQVLNEEFRIEDYDEAFEKDRP